VSSNLTPSATRLIFQWARHRAVPSFEQPTRLRSSKKFMRTSLAAPRDALIARGRWVWYWLRRGLWSDHILNAGPCRSVPAGAFAFSGCRAGLRGSLAQPRHRGRTASAAQCKRKTASRRSLRNRIRCFDQAATLAAAFSRFLRERKRKDRA
jgi:hypothetical protein